MLVWELFLLYNFMDLGGAVHTRTRAWSMILVAICFDGNVCNIMWSTATHCLRLCALRGTNSGRHKYMNIVDNLIVLL